jgi:sugar phosphate isomerase/epimerase
VEVAAKLGAPVIRVFADTQMRAQTWKSVSNGARRDQVEEWIAANIRECADHAANFGVIIGGQNHGDFLRTADDLIKLINRVDSPWCGAIVDTGKLSRKHTCSIRMTRICSCCNRAKTRSITPALLQRFIRV